MNANAASAPAIAAANVAGARRIILAIPDGFEASNVLKKARQLNPGIEIVARAHSDAEVEHLRQSGADFIIMGEREVARGMLAHVLETSQNDIAAAAAAEQAVPAGNQAGPPLSVTPAPGVEPAPAVVPPAPVAPGSEHPGLAEPAAAAQKETL